VQAAGRDAGLKLMEIKRLRAKGHRITLLNESRSLKLVGWRTGTGARPRERPQESSRSTARDRLSSRHARHP
jgi:hypothetical protein